MFIIGIDLGNEYSQICYYNFTQGQPESIDFSAPAAGFMSPTAVLREKEKEDGWMAGELAVSCNALGEGIYFDNLLIKAKAGQRITQDGVTVTPAELICVYLEYLIQTAQRECETDLQPDKICITVEDYDIDILSVIDKAFSLMGTDGDRIIFSSRVEAFVYYALSQPQELLRNDNVLLDYGRQGLKYCRMVTVTDRGKRIVMTEKKDFGRQVPYIRDMAALEERLTSTVLAEFEKKVISAVYLTGEGFEDGFSCDRFISAVCNRRRAFAGQNLYVKGACYQAYEMGVGNNFKDYIIGCNERITTGIEMKISDRGVDKILRLVRPGVNWYKADCSYDFILDDCDVIELFLSPVDTKEKKLITVPLSSFPKRDNKASRITVALSFTDDVKCHLTVTDRGFGEFVKSSDKVIKEDIML